MWYRAKDRGERSLQGGGGAPPLIDTLRARQWQDETVRDAMTQLTYDMGFFNLR